MAISFERTGTTTSLEYLVAGLERRRETCWYFSLSGGPADWQVALWSQAEDLLCTHVVHHMDREEAEQYAMDLIGKKVEVDAL